MTERLYDRVASLRALPNEVRKKSVEGYESVDSGLRADLVSAASEGIYGLINEKEQLGLLLDPMAAIICIGHQPLVGVSSAIHSKYLAQGLEREHGGRRFVVIDSVADVDAIGDEEGAIEISIPKISENGSITLAKLSPYGDVRGGNARPGKNEIFFFADAPSPASTDSFLAGVGETLGNLVPEKRGEIGERARFLREAFRGKLESCKNISEWSTLFKSIIYKECGIEIIFLSEKALLKTESALSGLKFMLKNWRIWTEAHGGVIAALGTTYMKEMESGVFPPVKREVFTDKGNVQELPFWIFKNERRFRAGVRLEGDEVVVVAFSKTRNSSGEKSTEGDVCEEFRLGRSEVLEDEQKLLIALKSSGLVERWAWDVLSFTFVLRKLWKLPYVTGRGGAKYDVVMEGISARVLGEEVPDSVMNRQELEARRNSPFFVGIPEERNPRHRYLPDLYNILTNAKTYYLSRGLAVSSRIFDEKDERKKASLVARKQGLERALTNVEEIMQSAVSILEIYLVGGEEALLKSLRTVEKYESWISSSGRLK